MKRWLMTFPEDRQSLPYYQQWAARFGAAAEPLSAGDPPPPDVSTFAGLLLSGGGDVEPARYGDGQCHAETYGVNPARDAMENALIDQFVSAGKPIVGICRGLQMLAVHFGGRLQQHVPDVVAEDVERHRNPKGYDCYHRLLCDGATRLGDALRGHPDVNSAHHQAMYADISPRHLRVAAQSPCGIVEAVECFDFAAPIVAVQWHPERLPPRHPGTTMLVDFLLGITGQP